MYYAMKSHIKMVLAREVGWIGKDNGNGGSGPLLPKSMCPFFFLFPKASELMARQATRQKPPWNPKMYHILNF